MQSGSAKQAAHLSEVPLKHRASRADKDAMQITVACHRCSEPKRPLSPCPACSAAPLAEPELQAWRLSLHAHHLERITSTPHARVDPAPTRAAVTPRRLVIRMEESERAPLPDPLPIVPPGTAIPAEEPLSFDWGDESDDLRRSA
jgi:hypothetical protein